MEVLMEIVSIGSGPNIYVISTSTGPSETHFSVTEVDILIIVLMTGLRVNCQYILAALIVDTQFCNKNKFNGAVKRGINIFTTLARCGAMPINGDKRTK